MQPIDSILDVAGSYDTIVFDQWGVLHNGSVPYEHAVRTIVRLMQTTQELCVLSNSGKRADLNRARITGMGFPEAAFHTVMTSGEALALDIERGALGKAKTLFAITAKARDAQSWATGLDVRFTQSLAEADAVLLMGLPDATDHPEERETLANALQAGKRVICSNPDHASPRANGKHVESPGALAHAYHKAGGEVVFYGKPHRPIFDTLFAHVSATDPTRVLMVGDSPEHDIAGAESAGWDSLFISGGLHAGTSTDLFSDLPKPNYVLSSLR